MTLPVFKDHNPANPWSVSNESHVIASNGTIRLVYAPKKGSLTITGFTETTNPSPGLTEFYCDYQDATDYRTAQQIVQFSVSQAGNTATANYLGVTQTLMAEHLNELKAHEENTGIHLTAEQATKIAGCAPLNSPALAGSPTVGGKAIIVEEDPRLANERNPVDSSVTDAKIGNRTADPATVAAYSSTGQLTQWLSWITKRFAEVTGYSWGTSLPASIKTLWELKWTEKYILCTPTDGYVSHSLPLSRNGTMTTMDFYVKGAPSAATTITVKQNGATAGSISLSATGKATLTFPTAVTGVADDLFTYTVTGGGLASCDVTCNQKWGNR